MRQRRWIELFSDYDCEIRYHPGKASVVVDALSRKERVKPTRVRAMNMTLQSSIKDRILAAQKEAVDESAGLTLIMDEAHKLKYSIHPGADKMYYNLRDRFLAVNQDAFGTRLDMSTAYHPQTDGQKRELKKLKRSRIAIVKVRWNSKCGPEFTWEREDQMKLKYPHLFSNDSS
ncbi:hypothetical protein Tco_1376169 [Tanacetum coccineum]